MTETKTLPVDLGERSYSIQIGSGIIAHFKRYFESIFLENRHAIIIYDQQVEQIAHLISKQLGDHQRRITLISVPSGEESKSVSRLNQIWQEMLEAQTDRGSVVLAVGGGVIGDLAGFAAATYARGLPLVQIPTTLLSQVDSSVGGKTGINLPEAKNIVGSFWQPRLVIIDTLSLESLPDREFVSGLAEVVKYGVILQPELFEFLEANADRVLSRDPDVLIHIISNSCRAKAQVVQEDERETSGRRAILNYGHTFAHAIESTAGYGRWLHGEAVSIGMNMAACLAKLLSRIDEQTVQRQASLLKRLRLPISSNDTNVDELWLSMQHDKKVMHGALNFVLPSRLGQVELVSGVTRHQVGLAIQESIKKSAD